MCVLCKQTYMQRPWVPAEHYSFPSRKPFTGSGSQTQLWKIDLAYLLHIWGCRSCLIVFICIHIHPEDWLDGINGNSSENSLRSGHSGLTLYWFYYTANPWRGQWHQPRSENKTKTLQEICRLQFPLPLTTLRNTRNDKQRLWVFIYSPTKL